MSGNFSRPRSVVLRSTSAGLQDLWLRAIGTQIARLLCDRNVIEAAHSWSERRNAGDRNRCKPEFVVQHRSVVIGRTSAAQRTPYAS